MDKDQHEEKQHSLDKEHYIRAFEEIYKECERLRDLLSEQTKMANWHKIEASRVYMLNMRYNIKILELEKEIIKLKIENNL